MCLIQNYVFRKRGSNQIIYEVYEYEELKDSSNINIEDWNKMAELIQKKYDAFGGFVILHGTDTMAYTSSALSFMFGKTCKPIVLTGSQKPMFNNDGKPIDDSDAKDNLLGALYVAGHVAIQKVTLFFNKKLFQGNRVIKFDCEEKDAFWSPNVDDLLPNVEDINEIYDMKRSEQKPLTHGGITQFNKNYVGILKLFPGITVETVRNFIQPENQKNTYMKGIVLETYGAGNAPTNTDEPSILNELKTAIVGGVLILNCTQCVKGVVSSDYETGRVLLDAGVIPGRDITPEAALAKLLYVLSKWDRNEEQREMLNSNLRNEINDTKTVTNLAAEEPEKLNAKYSEATTLSKVFVIYTGGTIGMTERDDQGTIT
ncbi:L-asparaginase 1-like [Anneissia japonica]|uniref:L-asparaginase 1-like n=1 Tax=Anneissia japonica TaxID=1529436 RepID=UPI00142560F9|nr:L-asparaginase 1-like [Anneissia japonica]